jgi:glucokinase
MTDRLIKDKRVVLTLDAGGTNFVFSAMQGGAFITEPIKMQSNAHDLKLCLDSIVSGFTSVKSRLKEEPVAISFAFPGPADYPRGIIGDLPNLPAFRGGIALGAYLERKFNIPVFINNDGNLFAYGEAMAGILPQINSALEKSGSSRRHHNLIGITLGTGFGVGLVANQQLIVGDNSNGGEGWLLRDVINPSRFIEHHMSAFALRREYASLAGIDTVNAPDPFGIYQIAAGEKEGNKNAAITVYENFGTVLGEGIATMLTLMDGVVVIGGGVTGASQYFYPAMMRQLHSHYEMDKGDKLNRLIMKVFDWDNNSERNEFLKGQSRTITIPESSETIVYDPLARTVVAKSALGASDAIAIGSYMFALNAIDNQNN